MTEHVHLLASRHKLSYEQLLSMVTAVTGRMRAARLTWAAAATCMCCYTAVTAATNTTGENNKLLDISTLLRDFQVIIHCKQN